MLESGLSDLHSENGKIICVKKKGLKMCHFIKKILLHLLLIFSVGPEAVCLGNVIHENGL